MEKLQLKDFLNYAYISNLKSSDDKERLAFVVSAANADTNGYDQNIYVLGQDVRQLTSGNHEAGFIWEDNDHLLFKAMRDEADKKKTADSEELSVFYRISTHGGEAVKAFEVPYTVTAYEKLDADRYLMCVNYNLNYSMMAELNDEEKQKLLKQKKADQAVEVVDELPFYFNGAGFINKTRSRLMLYSVSDQSVKWLTPLHMDVSGINLHPQKNKVLFSAVTYLVQPNLQAGIYCIDLNDQTMEELYPEGRHDIAQVCFFDDEILVLAAGNDRYGLNENPEFYLLKEGNLELLAHNEDAVGSSVGSDCRYGGGKMSFVKNGKFYFVTTRRNASHLYSLDHEGNIEPVFTEEGSLDCIAEYQDGIAAAAMLQGKLQEVYMLKDAGIQLSALNEKALKDKYVADYEKITFENDGVDLDGWVLKPYDYDPNKKYPAILDIHGGPKTVYGEVFYHEMQVWASEGYFVFFMNPRGGDGRGNAFADIRGKYGTIDYDDLMKFTDVVLEKYPAIDPARLGETGGSYGGFMSNWIIGHTDRFAAVASQRSIANWVGFNGTSDIGPHFSKDQCAGDVWEDMEKLWWHSPLKYADKAKTPTLFIHSDEDYRCPISEGYQMASALMQHGVPTRLVVFHGENHELSRGGKPLNRIRRLEEITNWMDKYCKGSE